MDDSKKKPLMIVILVVCLALAGTITYFTMGGKSQGGLETIDPEEQIWVKCSNEKCGTTYQTNYREYLRFVRDNAKSLQLPPMVCKQCGQESIYRAVKCEKCGEIFFAGSVPNDFEDRCPKCRFSKIEDRRKQIKSRAGQ